MKFGKIIRKVGKWTGIIIAALLIIVAAVYVFAYLQTQRRINKKYTVDYISIKVPGDSASIALGKHLFSVYACRDCHGENLEGKILINNFAVGRFTTANLTRGKGGLPEGYDNQDWLRALKHGLNKEGKPLVAMPSTESNQIPDEDLAAIIAYCKSVPAVDNELPELKVGPLMRILSAIGKVDPLAAEQINHQLTRIERPEKAVTPEYGATLAINCTGCHNADFNGGPSPIPDHPPVPNISSTGRVGKWTEEQFMQTLRSGITPDGHKLKNEEMPWERFKEFSDVELKALRAYLLTFPKENTIAKSN